MKKCIKKIIIFLIFIAIILGFTYYYFKHKSNPKQNFYQIPTVPNLPSKTPYKGLCIFDWDGTIGNISDKQGNEAAQYCIDQGYAVAGLTAGLHSRSDYIKKLGMPMTYWAEGIFNKGPVVKKWSDDLKQRGHPLECTILFDDSNCANDYNKPGINTKSIMKETGLCVYQNSCNPQYQISKDQVKFAINNCKNTKTIIYKQKGNIQKPFLYCG